MTKSNLLLLHGALGSQQQLEPLAALLSSTFRVFPLEFEGHGNTGSTAGFSMGLFAENTLAFLDAHGIDQAHIFGYSMGGYVALSLAKTQPERVGGIFTLGTKFNWTPESAAKETKMLDPDFIEQKVPRFAEKLKQVHAGNDWKEVLHKTADMMIGLGAGKGLSDQDLGQISHRALIGIGSLDKMVSVEESENAASHLAGGQSRIIDGFHHPLEKNDMEVLAKMITDFVYQV